MPTVPETSETLSIIVNKAVEKAGRRVERNIGGKPVLGPRILPTGKECTVTHYWKAIFPKTVTSASRNRDVRDKTREEQLAAFAENWDIDLSQNGFEKAAAKALGTVVEDEAFSQLAGNIVYVVSDDGYQTLLYDEVFNEELIEEMGRAFKRRLRCNSRSIEVFREEARRFLAASDDSDEEGKRKRTIAYFLLSALLGPGQYVDCFDPADQALRAGETPRYRHNGAHAPAGAAKSLLLQEVSFSNGSYTGYTLRRDQYLFPVGDPVFIGREIPAGEHGIILPSTLERVSRRHVRITYNGNGSWTVQDLDSTYGTLVLLYRNDRVSPILIGDGDRESSEVRIGDVIALGPSFNKDKGGFYPDAESGIAFLVSAE